MRLRIDENGNLRLPDALLDRWGISPGRRVEARVEKDRLVLEPLPVEEDPFEAGVKGPDAAAFEKAMQKDAEDKEEARRAFDRLLGENKDLDLDREREERDRWR